MRADRLMSLVLLLQARGRMTARELAGELDVSVRTIYRDLEGLSAAGVPVFAESGPGGGCQLLDDYRFPLRSLRGDEAEALLLLGVPDALRELGIKGGRGALVHLDMPGWFRGREPVPHLLTLASAVRSRRQVVLSYGSGTRVVGPLGLVNKAGTWYLVATAGERITVFRVGRVLSASVQDQAVRRPPGFDLVSFWADWSLRFQESRPRLAVRLRASADALAVFPEIFGDAVRSVIAVPSDEHGWRELTLSFEHELAAAHRLAGFGDQVEVLSPVAVRERLLDIARGIVRRYGGECSG